MYCGKNVYESREEAEETARYQEEQNPGLILKVYKCRICYGWHMSKRK